MRAATVAQGAAMKPNRPINALPMWAAAVLALSMQVVRANPELAQKRICMGCHTVAEKRVGPAFKDIANRYAGQHDAATKLAEKIVKGGGGVWGAVPMPANPKVTPEEARQLAIWVLGLK